MSQSVKPFDHAAAANARFDRQIDTMAVKLRALAAGLEGQRIGPKTPVAGRLHANVASNIVQEVMWGVANLGLDSLGRLGTEADTMARETRP